MHKNRWRTSYNKWYPVMFLSKSLSAVKCDYKIHNMEMLIIIQVLEEWYHYLKGAQHPTEIWTNHKNLKYFCISQKPNHHQA